jgi:hypothetical protein
MSNRARLRFFLLSETDELLMRNAWNKLVWL